MKSARDILSSSGAVAVAVAAVGLITVATTLVAHPLPGLPAEALAAQETAAGAPASPDAAQVEQIVAGYLEARGGAERWREVQTIEAEGYYSAFSERNPFKLLRRRGDLYRLDYNLLGAPAIRARDSQGTWGQHKLLMPETGRFDEDPYKGMFERESLFGPLLVDYEERGLSVAFAGPGEVDGIATLNLTVTFPNGAEETWMLDAETHLEVAVDSQVHDYTQAMAPMRQRAFYDDFRDVDGLVLPFVVELEFGARLESMMVESYAVDGDGDGDGDGEVLTQRLTGPPPAEPEGEEAPAAPDESAESKDGGDDAGSGDEGGR